MFCQLKSTDARKVCFKRKKNHGHTLCIFVGDQKKRCILATFK